MGGGDGGIWFIIYKAGNGDVNKIIVSVKSIPNLG